MADKKKKAGIRDIEGVYKDANKQAERMRELQERELSGLEKVFSWNEKILNSKGKLNTENEKLSNMTSAFEKIQKSGLKVEKRTFDAFKKRVAEQQKSVKLADRHLKIQESIKATVGEFLKISTTATKGLFKFLMDSDKAIKSTALELGLSGDRSEAFRDNIDASAAHAARLGASVEDLTKAASVYAAETGRVKDLTQDTYKAIVNIGKGTSLGIEQAADLAGKYDLMGVNATKAATQVQEIVDTTERMGVNTGKVLKKINDNFKRLQKYTFQQGVKGFAEMASYAEKFKVDMGATLDAADKARTLEGAVDLAAQLQVMGGEFAKTDPFELLFLSRNDPAKFTQKINEMTKGVVTFKKNADGSIEKFITPQDIDRLNQVGKALGMQNGELIEQALRMADVQKMRQQMMGSGLDKNQMDLVEGLAQMGDDGTFTVKVGSDIKKLSELTSKDIAALETQKKTLEARAKESQTVEQAFQNTLMELKTSLLPLLKDINSMLNAVRPVVEKIVDFFHESNAWVKGGLAVAAALTLAGGSILKSFLKAKIMGAFGGGGGMMGGAKGAGGGMMSGSQMMGQGKGALASGKGAGLAGLGKGAGVGLAGAGVGGGIMMAAKGIASLADSLKGLNDKQLQSLEKIALGLGIALPAMAIGMVLVGKAAEASVIGIGILTLAILGIGAGIGMATAGIGAMAEGFGSLMEAANPMDVLKMAGGMTALAGASILFANPLSMVGLAGMSGAVLAMASAGPGMEQVGKAFENIGVVLQGSSSQLKEVRDTIQAISSTEVSSNSGLANLATLLSKPLKVEFADKNVGFVAKIDVNMDGQKMFDTMNIARKVEIRQNMYREGKASPKAT